MVLTGLKFLDSVKINEMVQTLADKLESNQRLIFLERTEIVDADDEEIVGRFRGQVFAADIIADDQEATIYESGSFEFVTANVPNLKLGARLGQTMLNRLNRLKRNSALRNDLKFFTDWENGMADRLVTGLRQRVNALICAMQLDSLNYNRMGVKLENASWGMPSNLKVTPSTPWSNTSATPLTDIQVMAQEIATDIHGEQFNRVTMSTKVFRYITQTDEFKERVKGELRFDFGSQGFNWRDQGATLSLLANLINMEIELYDGVYWTRNSRGNKVQQRVQPQEKVIFSDSNDDNNRETFDFANGIVTESLVMGIRPGEESFPSESFGPIAYYTTNPTLNAPDVSAWAVQRGFPRKHRETATAVITAY